MSNIPINIFEDVDHPVFKDILVYSKIKMDDDKFSLHKRWCPFKYLKQLDDKIKKQELDVNEKQMLFERALAMFKYGVYDALTVQKMAPRMKEIAIASLDERMLEYRNKDGTFLGWEWNLETSENQRRTMMLDGFRVKIPENEEIPKKYKPNQRVNVIKITNVAGRVFSWVDVSNISYSKYIPLSQPIYCRLKDDIFIIPFVKDWAGMEAVNVVPTGYVFY